MKNYKYLVVSSAKVGNKKKRNMAKQNRRVMTGVWEVEGNSKIKTRLELELRQG